MEQPSDTAPGSRQCGFPSGEPVVVTILTANPPVQASARPSRTRIPQSEAGGHWLLSRTSPVGASRLQQLSGTARAAAADSRNGCEREFCRTRVRETKCGASVRKGTSWHDRSAEGTKARKAPGACGQRTGKNGERAEARGEW